MTAQKKALPAAARDTPRVVALRAAFLDAVARNEDPRRLNFGDETGRPLAFARRGGRAPGGQRIGQGLPLRVGTLLTLVGAWTVNGLEAVMSLDGPLNAAGFAVYLEPVLGLTLVPGEGVVLDKLPVPKVAGMAALVEARGARLLFLPPYSPDFAPLETAWSNLKTALRTATARTRDALERALD